MHQTILQTYKQQSCETQHDNKDKLHVKNKAKYHNPATNNDLQEGDKLNEYQIGSSNRRIL